MFPVQFPEDTIGRVKMCLSPLPGSFVHGRAQPTDGFSPAHRNIPDLQIYTRQEAWSTVLDTPAMVKNSFKIDT